MTEFDDSSTSQKSTDDTPQDASVKSSDQEKVPVVPAQEPAEDERTHRASNASFDEQLFLDKIEKDPFQKELDEAIEHRTLADFISEHPNFLGLYEFDAEKLEYSIKVNGVEYKHRTTNPTSDDETRKELMSVTVRKALAKVDGDDAVSAVNDNGNALRRYYDGIGFEIFGYPVAEGDDAEQWIAVAQIVEKSDDLADKEREQYRVGKDKDLTVLHLIPEADKLKVAALVHAGSCVVIREKNQRIRSLRSKREYVVKQLFGVKPGDDGTLSKPTHCVAYHFNEAGAKAISKFDAYAVPGKTIIKEGGNEEHRTLSIPTLDALFDAHIAYLQGASVDGEEILGVLQDDARLAKIPSACKRDATVIFFNALKS